MTGQEPLRRRAARTLEHTEYDSERFTQTDGTKGFHSEVLSTDVIPLCAAFAAQENGSARLAIKYLQKACKTADTRGEKTVLEQHVREIMNGHENVYINIVGIDHDDLNRITNDLHELGLDIEDEQIVHHEYVCPYRGFLARENLSQ